MNWTFVALAGILAAAWVASWWIAVHYDSRRTAQKHIQRELEQYMEHLRGEAEDFDENEFADRAIRHLGLAPDPGE